MPPRPEGLITGRTEKRKYIKEEMAFDGVYHAKAIKCGKPLLRRKRRFNVQVWQPERTDCVHRAFERSVSRSVFRRRSILLPSVIVLMHQGLDELRPSSNGSSTKRLVRMKTFFCWESFVCNRCFFYSNTNPLYTH